MTPACSESPSFHKFCVLLLDHNMSEGQGAARLALAIYRGLHKWCTKTQKSGIPLLLRSSDVYACVPEARAIASLDLQDATTVQTLARKFFRSGKLLQGEEASAALERGLLALRLLNTEYSTQLRLLSESRQAHSDRQGVEFEVGTVFLHKRYGYRGVLFGWDRRCLRDEQWVAEAGVDPEQPFYYVLPDERDCMRLFQQPLSSRYVAQDNIMPLPGERILHRSLNHFFSGHSVALGRYIPTPKLQYEYPGRYSADDSQEDCVAADSNLLLHEEEEEGGSEKGSGGGRRSGRGRRRSGFKPVSRGDEQEVTI